eukprot:CAMPEP_0196167842 /NCGR_PEP_ID=MMETSP0911-20130528/2868_1 /TAXON_ID=49265 /ORGANISM="Thalassiosira rotula, Strain GSO102" /LENGTH=54 /DNA_ID=CAMNT_0041433771 /DNA_START=328 /DNA_END=488 /DNA_ORIENTATION=-
MGIDPRERLLQYNSNALETKKQEAELDVDDSRFWASVYIVGIHEINPKTKSMFR